MTLTVFICAFPTACYTGMRTGEVFALTWNDIDLENRTIKINKTVYARDKENYYISSTIEGIQKANTVLENIIQSDITNKIINFEEFVKRIE